MISSCKYFNIIKNFYAVPATCKHEALIYLYGRSCYSNRNYSNFLIPKIKMNNPARTSTVILENYYVQVANYFKNSFFKLNKHYFKKENGFWACRVIVEWPSHQEFVAEESKKSEAARLASLYAIDWLKNQNKIDRDGRPLLVKELNANVDLNLDAKLFESIRELTSKYINEIKPIYDEYDSLHSNQKLFSEENIFPSYEILSENKVILRNKALHAHLNEIPPKTRLPIDEFSDKIVSTIQNNRVVVIKGSTGSGKTSRVPQMIFDHYIKEELGTDCNIIVTQPRRISATSLATRIAFERDENLGFSVGYHVRFNKLYPPQPGTILFLSTGILLQRLLIDPNLNNVSHVFIDEAHERDVNIDLLLMLMKIMLEENDKIRIIIMSASINPEIFQQYFNNCPLLSIPGFMYKVQIHYLDDEIISKNLNIQSKYNKSANIDDNLIIDFVNWIHCNKEPGAILVFLPGWSDITKIQNVLIENTYLSVVTAHSKLRIEQQQLIFEPPVPGKRKVILATNIAESSITIPDVVYVIDSGIVRELGFFNGIRGLVNKWISKAVADQRQGRAGRVKEGECYRLYSRSKFETFDEYPVPEVLRLSLEKLVISIKMYRNDSVSNTMSMFLEPPLKNVIDEAITYLKQIYIMDNDENLTALGRRIASFGLHPSLSVALVYSVFFNCVNPMLLITSYLNGDATIFGIDAKCSIRRNSLFDYHATNDLVAVFNIYNTWRKNLNILGEPEILPHFNRRSIETFDRVSKLNLDYLRKAHLIGSEENIDEEILNFDSDQNLYLVSPILLAATGKLAINDMPYFTNGKVNHYLTTLDARKVQISADSVNFKNSQTLSPFLTFYNMNTTEGFLRIYDTAAISPIAVLLFCPVLPDFFTNDSNILTLVFPNTDLKMKAEKESVEKIIVLREIMWSSINYFVNSYHDSCVEQSQKIHEFRKELQSILKTILQDRSSL